MSYGGIDCVASSWRSAVSDVHVVALEGVDVAGQELALLLVERRRSGRSGSRSLAEIVARARWRALLTEATLVSSSSATSSAFQRSTSRRISTARCRGGRCCSAATNASRTVSREAARSAGSPSAGSTRPSGIGRIQVASGSVPLIGAAALCAGPRSIGRARRSRPFSMSRQTFVAMR